MMRDGKEINNEERVMRIKLMLILQHSGETLQLLRELDGFHESEGCAMERGVLVTAFAAIYLDGLCSII